MPAKRIFPIALALLLGVSFATPSGARAATFEEGGLRYETEDITTGASTVTVAIVMGCVDTCPDGLVIPNTAGGYPVTRIANSAFARSSVKTAVIGNSVTDIGVGAFEGTASNDKGPLTSVTLGTSVQSIGVHAFRWTNLTSVSISNSVTSIADGAFAGSLLTSVTWGSSLTTIGMSAFADNALTSLTFSSPLTTIGELAFYNNLLTAVTFSNSVTSVGDSAFRHNRITSVTLPNSLTTIGNSVFYQNLLTSVTIPNTVTRIGDYAFSQNRLPSVTIPDSVTSIGRGAFHVNLLTTLTLGNSVTSIGSTAFGEHQFTTLTIPNSVTTIGDGAFGYGTLASLVIGSGVTSIGNDAFKRNQLTSITFGSSVANIGNEAFLVNQLTSVTLPASLTSIGNYAFAYNDDLTSATFLGNAPTAGTEVFANTRLTSVTRFNSKTGWGSTWSSKTVAITVEATAKPYMSGTVAVGNTITANPGTWDGPATPTFAYQWYACTAAITTETQAVPATCSAISSATQGTFVITAAESGKFIAVGVTASSVGATPATWLSTTITKAPPVNTVAPVVTGSASVYSALTASTGTWTGVPTPTLSYQWLRCTAAGAAANTLPAGCTTISGATQATYAIDAADYQKYLRVQVTATNDLGSATKYTAATAKIAGRITVNTVAPIITGTTTINATLTGAKGTWAGYPAPTYTYQWLRCTRAGSASDALPSGCTTISGATRTTYKLTTTDYGKYLRLKVVGKNSLGSDTKYSAATAKIAGIDPVNTVAPRITGTPKVGSTVTGTKGTWTGFPTPATTYQWFRCTSAGSASTAQPSGCTAISGATRSTYKLVAADKTSGYLRVRVTGTSAEGRVVRFSAAVKVQ